MRILDTFICQKNDKIEVKNLKAIKSRAKFI